MTLSVVYCMFHLHFVLFKKSEFVMSLIVLTLVVTEHRGPAGVKYAGNSI